MPELRHLRTFVAVAEERNFTRAAARLHLAQQAVSKAIRQLEDELGVELLERTTHEVRLTPAGAALLAPGRAVLAAAEDAFARARAVGRGEAGTIRLAASPAVGAGVLEAAVAAIQGDSEAVSVSIRDVRPGEVRRLLRDREVELLLARTLPDAPEVARAPLRPTPAVLAVPAGHRLAGRDDAGLAELDGERFLVASAAGTPYTDLLLAPLARAGARVELVTRRILGAGAGIDELATREAVTLVPAGSPRAPGVVHVALREAVTLPLLLAWPAGAASPAVARVREALG